MTLSCRKASLAAVVLTVAPVLAQAQTAAPASPTNDTTGIGYLVVWLLAIGGIISAVGATALDRRLRGTGRQPTAR